MARRPRYNKGSFTLPDGSTLVADTQDMGYGSRISLIPRGGMVSHSKPGKQGAIQSIMQKFVGYFKETPYEKTTEQGSAGSASPSTYEMQTLLQRYERRFIIQDCWQMYYDDPRARRALQKFARESARKGCVPVFKATGKKRTVADATQIAEEVCLKVKNKLKSWALTSIIEGDLFVQLTFAGEEFVRATRMPAIAMERNSNDADTFNDPAKAFSQLDILSNQEIATFPLALLFHGRWNHIDGDRYGSPEAIAGRRLRRNVELSEEAQRVRRFTRAAQIRMFNIGTDDKVGTPEEVQRFKEENGFIEGVRDVFNPMEIARDFFGNGITSVTTIPGDQGVSDIADILHDQDVYMQSFPTPKALIGLDAESINRDVLEDQRGEMLKETQLLTELLEECVRFIIDMALLVKGIVPESVPYTLKWSDSDIDPPSVVISRVNEAAGANPNPLISHRTAVQAVAEYFGIQDVDAEILEIQKEQDYARLMQAETMAAQFGKGPSAEQIGTVSPETGQPPNTEPPAGPEMGDQVNAGDDLWDISELNDGWVRPIFEYAQTIAKHDRKVVATRNGHH